jgi:hypothetical protein
VPAPPVLTIKKPDAADLVPADISREDELLGEEHGAEQAEEVRIRRAKGRLRAQHKALNVPQGLTGKAAEDWADKKAVELLPFAMAELEYQLSFGDNKQRAEAAKEVREMTGRGKRDGSGGGGPTIILVGSSDGQNPFLKRVDVPKQLTDKKD